MITYNFNGFTNLCFRNNLTLLFVIFSLFCIFSPFPWLSLTKDRSYWFRYDVLGNLSRIIALKANDF